MKKRFMEAILLVLASGSLAAGPGGDNADYPLLPRQQEIELARSAGLAPWNEKATIYVMERQGYVVAEPGSNGFSCLVGRDHPGTQWPVCFDPIGSRAIVPRILRETELRLEGKTQDEVQRDTAERFLKGLYRAPERTGVSYMLNPKAVTFDGEKLIYAPPHLMIYAPNVTREEVGAVRRHPHSPMILSEGDPHAYLIVFVRDDFPRFEPVTKR